MQLFPATSTMFSSSSIPTIFDKHHANILVDGTPISLVLEDTSGQDEYTRLRPLSYYNADVIIMFYSVISPTSLENVNKKWLPEIRHHCPNTPFLLVGTKSDLRKDGYAGREELSAARVMECSAKTQVGLQEVFNEAIRVALAARGTSIIGKKDKCVLL